MVNRGGTFPLRTLLVILFATVANLPLVTKACAFKR